jgi:RNA polymerase sigma-70 factor, ECF subfamily
MATSPRPNRLSIRLAHPGVTQTPVQCEGSARIGQGARLQFTAFDAFYLERLQRGDAGTERHFTAYFSELIRIKLRSRLSTREAIEDVSQETFVRVLALVRSEQGIRHPERLGALVNSVCNHVLLEHYRAHGRTRAPLDEDTDSASAEEGVSVSGSFEADEAVRIVRHILSELPERDRRLLQAVLLDERDKDEVCAEWGLSRDYLRVLVHRAKQSFKSSYRKRLGELQ